MKAGIKALLYTWLFWIAVGLININLMATILLIPVLPLWPYLWSYYENVHEFLLVPGGVDFILSALFATYVVKSKKFRRSGVLIKTLFVNVVFMLSFFVTGDFYKSHLISKTLVEKNVDCFWQGTFMNSMSIAGREFQFNIHAVAVIEGEPYFWSYRDLNFYKTERNTYQNINMMGCAKYVEDL